MARPRSGHNERAINAHAAQSGYTLLNMDIYVDVLKGLTFADIAKATGYPLRQVQLIPQHAAELMR